MTSTPTRQRRAEAVDLSSLEFVHGRRGPIQRAPLVSPSPSRTSTSSAATSARAFSPDLDEIDSNETDAFGEALGGAWIALSIECVAASPLADVAVGGARKFGIGDAVV